MTVLSSTRFNAAQWHDRWKCSHPSESVPMFHPLSPDCQKFKSFTHWMCCFLKKKHVSKACLSKGSHGWWWEKLRDFSVEHNGGYLGYWIFSFTLQSCFELPEGPLLSCLVLPLSFEKCTYFQQTVTCLRQHFLKIKQNIKWLWPPAVTSAVEVGLGNTESSSGEQFVATLSRINRNVGHFLNTVEGSLRFGVGSVLRGVALTHVMLLPEVLCCKGHPDYSVCMSVWSKYFCLLAMLALRIKVQTNCFVKIGPTVRRIETF